MVDGKQVYITTPALQTGAIYNVIASITHEKLLYSVGLFGLNFKV